MLLYSFLRAREVSIHYIAVNSRDSDTRLLERFIFYRFKISRGLLRIRQGVIHLSPASGSSVERVKVNSLPSFGNGNRSMSFRPAIVCLVRHALRRSTEDYKWCWVWIFIMRL
jgi:hypothetical protein|uniref:Uncharacterized protein n=1 Tax=Picea glauca TaxID=3330 RepID=A0A101LZ44_PICGL|nr:hypothetical protein ABT39_MTgene4922 [Picea glauca]QHR88620.1 hypothetical protein Q903MT_gene2634 [Picea sitchensis]